MHVTDQARILRCAIYTRKSTDDRLDQEINSLEAQRDTCAAYVRSQRHKGWRELPERYDDGGWSGGDLVRPALQRLLGDVEAGRVDVVVIYKIDRLSRSLVDFVRLIDVFERFDVSFVSITQAFDTSDSMGRLVLNVLLTFAQFERELMADRIRDKIATLKRRGKWTGGRAPFGYDRVDGRLIVHEAEATQVREIYDRYPLAASGNQLLRQLREEGVRNKSRVSRGGQAYGGRLFGPGILHRILTNPLYLGRIEHRGEWHEGEHAAIVTREQWDAVQARRAERRECQIPRRPTDSMLQGILHDAHGRRMHPEVQVKGGRRFGYYATELTREGQRQRLKVLRVGAEEVEGLAVAALRTFLCDRPALSEALVSLGSYDARTTTGLKSGPRVAAALGRVDGYVLRTVVRAVVARAELDRERLVLLVSCFELSRLRAWDGVVARAELDRERLVMLVSCFELWRLLAWDGVGAFGTSREAPTRLSSRVHRIDAPAAIVREARQICLPLPAPSAGGRPSGALIRLLDEAREARERLYADPARDLVRLAGELGRGPAWVSRLVRLTYLAPDIVAAIMDGDQPDGLDRTTLLKQALPLDWAQQRTLFGFPPRRDEGGSFSRTLRGHSPKGVDCLSLD